ncbi:MAG: S-adenosylmethionine:tRNA ribosyltransferase-isomerase [Bdellovibrio sp.]|nr:MAG: S-adenosylmethionine:tRNA ribosyltransferase-isomerase [Bdellovibrio sp.]
MQRRELCFDFPESLIATEPRRPSRVMWVEGPAASPIELDLETLKSQLHPGDVVVVNDTRVVKRRVFTHEGLEILFLREIEPRQWQVLFPSRELKVGAQIFLPGGVKLTLLRKGRPQLVLVNADLQESYFERFGELPLPPYIQKARGERHHRGNDGSKDGKLEEKWYQTAWNAKPGSLAAPTASLHWTRQDLEDLRRRDVGVEQLTLHVGLGTFLPVTADRLQDHAMHEEWVEIPAATWERTRQCRGRVWALGTTVARALESAARGQLSKDQQGFFGGTNLFLYPGQEWLLVKGLLTNFHQPESTLLALVASFCDLPTVKAAYQWAIKNRFRLFSYGDLTAWKR